MVIRIHARRHEGANAVDTIAMTVVGNTKFSRIVETPSNEEDRGC